MGALGSSLALGCALLSPPLVGYQPGKSACDPDPFRIAHGEVGTARLGGRPGTQWQLLRVEGEEKVEVEVEGAVVRVRSLVKDPPVRTGHVRIFVQEQGGQEEVCETFVVHDVILPPPVTFASCGSITIDHGTMSPLRLAFSGGTAIAEVGDPRPVEASGDPPTVGVPPETPVVIVSSAKDGPNRTDRWTVPVRVVLSDGRSVELDCEVTIVHKVERVIYTPSGRNDDFRTADQVQLPAEIKGNLGASPHIFAFTASAYATYQVRLSWRTQAERPCSVRLWSAGPPPRVVAQGSGQRGDLDWEGPGLAYFASISGCPGDYTLQLDALGR